MEDVEESLKAPRDLFQALFYECGEAMHAVWVEDKVACYPGVLPSLLSCKTTLPEFILQMMHLKFDVVVWALRLYLKWTIPVEID